MDHIRQVNQQKKGAYQVQRGRREVKQTPQTQHIIIHHITFQTQTMWNSKNDGSAMKRRMFLRLAYAFLSTYVSLGKAQHGHLVFHKEPLSTYICLNFMSTVDKSGRSTFHQLEDPPSSVSSNFGMVNETKHIRSHRTGALKGSEAA